jgi:hypothetical protein
VADLSAGFDLPNPYGLKAADFNYDTAAYRIALAFLSDIAGGTDESYALANNGGSTALLRAWEGDSKFRRVLAKCREANRRAHDTDAAPGYDPAAHLPPPGEQRFVPIDEIPTFITRRRFG